MNNRDAHAEGPDLAALAGLLADNTRAGFCLALLDGRPGLDRDRVGPPCRGGRLDRD